MPEIRVSVARLIEAGTFDGPDSVGVACLYLASGLRVHVVGRMVRALTLKKVTPYGVRLTGPRRLYRQVTPTE